MAGVAAVQQHKLPSTVVRHCARVSNLKLSSIFRLELIISLMKFLFHCESAHLFQYANWRLLSSLLFSSLLIFMSLCLKIKLSINNQPPTPSPTASTWTRNSIWMWIVMDICAGAFASWFMAFDCQPCNYNKIYPMATITITITITSDNRRRCNAHAVAGDCWQRFDHHNYRTGNRNTHICGNICAEFTSQSPARQQGDSSRCGHPTGGCL